MTNLRRVANWLWKESQAIKARIERLEEQGRATTEYLDLLQEMADELRDAAEHIDHYYELRGELKRRVLDVPRPGKRSRQPKARYEIEIYDSEPEYEEGLVPTS